MPIYEYECAKCQAEFEVEQRISDDPIKMCPKCRSKRVKRLISKTSFVLKGGGWYSDLYSSSGGKSDKDGDQVTSSGDSKGSKSESASDSKTESKSDSKTESKSDSKTESKSESKSESKDSSKVKDKPSKSKGKAKG